MTLPLDQELENVDPNKEKNTKQSIWSSTHFNYDSTAAENMKKFGWRETKREEDDDLETNSQRKRKLWNNDDCGSESLELPILEDVPSKVRKPLEYVNGRSSFMNHGARTSSGVLTSSEPSPYSKPLYVEIPEFDDKVSPLLDGLELLDSCENHRGHHHHPTFEAVNTKRTIFRIKEFCQKMTSSEQEHFLKTVFGCSNETMSLILRNFEKNQMSETDKKLITKMYDWLGLPEQDRKKLALKSSKPAHPINFTPYEVDYLQKVFKMTPNPSLETIQKLSDDMKVTPSVILEFYENCRLKTV